MASSAPSDNNLPDSTMRNYNNLNGANNDANEQQHHNIQISTSDHTSGASINSSGSNNLQPAPITAPRQQPQVSEQPLQQTMESFINLILASGNQQQQQQQQAQSILRNFSAILQQQQQAQPFNQNATANTSNNNDFQIVIDAPTQQTHPTAAPEDRLPRHNQRSQPQDANAPATDAAPTAPAANNVNATENLLQQQQALRELISQVRISHVMAVCMRLIPILLILTFIFFYDYGIDLLAFVWLSMTSVTMNERVKQQAALQLNRNARVILWLMAMLFGHILLVFFFFDKQDLYKYLLFDTALKAEDFVVLRCFFTVVTVDFIVKLTTMFCKAGMILTLGGCSMLSVMQRGRMYEMAEILFQLYRVLLPVNIWARFILQPYYNQKGFAYVCLVLYGIMKIEQILARTASLIRIVRSVLSVQPMYGVYASVQDVLNTGEECPICKEDHKNAIKLECNHCFCEECVSQWLERNMSCPLCRANVKKAGNGAHSDGSTSLMIHAM